jgi:hypothetical protein
MELYHGSNQIITQPDLLKGRKLLDFGRGFYLSEEQKQAGNRAKLAILFFQGGQPTINVFVWDSENSADLNVLHFPSANIEWLDFVLANRNGKISENKYDVVVGPTANDKTILTIDQYMAGTFDHLPNQKELVIQLFQPEKLATQYLFVTEKSLKNLHFINSYTL